VPYKALSDKTHWRKAGNGPRQSFQRPFFMAEVSGLRALERNNEMGFHGDWGSKEVRTGLAGEAMKAVREGEPEGSREKGEVKSFRERPVSLQMRVKGRGSFDLF